VDVKGKSRLRVVLEEESVSLKEVTISQKRITDKILPEPTDIEVRGNYFHVKTRVRVPREMFSHNTRLVVQPVLNNATRKQVTLMKPMVYDAREYNETQDRLYNFDLNDSLAGDPLARYITVKSEQTREKGRPNDIIGYNDSIYVEHVKDDFSCDVYMAIENYNRILYRDTTIIARGTVNPLRFLDYSFAAHELTDSAYFPKKEVQLRDSQGKVNLRFPVGKAVFDSNDPQNASEIDKLRQQIETISQSKGASLSSLELRGQSSPEGRYSRNMSLAKMRMDYALGFLKRTLPADMTQGMTFTSDATVAPWSRVAEILRKDTLASEADRVEAILAAHPGNIEAQGRAIQRLPFYHKIIATRCLPQLRRVDYTLHYNVYRTLTIDEIAQLYAQDYSQLSKYEFFKLYRAEADTAKRVAMMRQALEVYPSFMAAANDLSVQLINHRQYDASLLRPFAGAGAPQEVNVNQLITLLNEGLYASADSVAHFVNDNESTHTMLAVNAVLNGRYDSENYATIAKTGKRNEVVMLLAMKLDDAALRMSRQLPDNEAVSHYLRAICLNRTNDPTEAYEELKRAFAMDPSLKEIAKTDGDVTDLLSTDKQQ
jgi:tetratricopeptide (TPR) repeat protein